MCCYFEVVSYFIKNIDGSQPKSGSHHNYVIISGISEKLSRVFKTGLGD